VEFLNDRVGEYFTGDTLDLSLRLVAGETAVERELEILALADVGDCGMAELFQRAVNGLALWVEDSLLERDVYVSFNELFLLNYRVPLVAVAREWSRARMMPLITPPRAEGGAKASAPK